MEGLERFLNYLNLTLIDSLAVLHSTLAFVVRSLRARDGELHLARSPLSDPFTSLFDHPSEANP